MKFLTLAVFVLVDIVCGISVKKRSAEDSQGIHTCEYNGQTFQEGDVLPTHHLCLDCKCTKDFVEPSDSQCRVIQCPEAVGCTPTYNSTECCPTSWDCDNIKETKKCDKRYFKHYEAKGCTPVYGEDPDCPIRFQCPEPGNQEEKKEVCRFQGQEYKRSEAVDIGNPCQICSCQQRTHSKLEIVCIGIECPSVFGVHPNNSCYDVYEELSCCPTSTRCFGSEPEENPAKVCVYDEKTYQLGQRIYPKEDPCLICTCTEDWTGIQGNSCRIHNCALERKRWQLENGCIPIYHEKTCCPIEFFCGSEEHVEQRNGPSVTEEEIASGNTCFFKGVHYSVGEYLGIHHPTNCVTCQCSTPPDFTCVHRSCPRPPNDDYVNCHSHYTPGNCCPTYECKPPQSERPAARRSSPKALKCTPVQCPKECSKVTVSNSCPFCHCAERLCSAPKCPSGCQVTKNVPAGQCPTCHCPDSIKVVDQCLEKNVTCPSWCTVAVDPFGCSSCVCGGLCSPPKCAPGCKVERDVGKGECPRCTCPSDPEDMLHCSPVQCPPACHEVTGESGCPSCICEPQCSMPKCDPGCQLQHPSHPYECSKCVCGDQDNIPILMCAPVKCGPLCREALNGRGCPTCICDPQCAVPRCDAGCRLDYDRKVGPCPRCVCDKVCPSVVCGSMCRQVMGADGCPSCMCGPLCSAPKCEPDCYLRYDGMGACPACVCDQDNRGVSSIHCSMPQCEPGCTIDYSTQPCPSCNCGGVTNSRLPCGTLDCPSSCRIDYSASPCPSCVCVGPIIPEHCAQPNCGDGCLIEYASKPCPTCDCPPPPITITLSLQCTTPICRPECQINYDAKPCPVCTCSSLQCTPVQCSPNCQINNEAKPCPQCVCSDVDLRGLPSIQCSAPKCDDPGCSIDYDSKPCPRCNCVGQVTSTIQCSPPKCDDPGCSIDYSTKPCPACKCTGSPVLQCTPLKCDDPGCSIDYSSTPCPSCHCSVVQSIQCTMPYCNPACFVDYSTKPCPSCSCVGAPKVMCSVPRCISPCYLDFGGECPTCICNADIYRVSPAVSTIQCSPPKCDEPGCSIDYSTKPCPSCSCQTQDPPTLQCSPPKCDDPGCSIDYSTKPCPSCNCQGLDPPTLQCSPPKCDDPGCSIDYSTMPCPSCNCQGLGMPIIQCSPPKCDEPRCRIDYSTKPCPSCKCQEPEASLHCSPVKCGEGCIEMIGSDGCTTCRCKEPICSTPQCGAGCRVDYYADPCPTCVCDRNMRSYAAQLHTYQDPICRQFTCGPRCQKAPAPVNPDQQCPYCICQVRGGEAIKHCAAMQCQLPCRWKRFVEHGCPSCVCNMGMEF